MSFKLHENYKITITAGDSRELDLRTFNKDSLPRWEPREPRWKIPALLPLRDAKGNVITDHIPREQWDSEGNVIVDSEGNPILNSEGFPVYPQTFDSEGHPLWPWYRVMGRGPRFDMKHWPKLPSGFHQLQEEPIWGEIKIIVTDLPGSTVILEKSNDEYPNSIFFDREDTIDIPAGLYLYMLVYTTEKDTDTEEVQTLIDDAWFEVYK